MKFSFLIVIILTEYWHIIIQIGLIIFDFSLRVGCEEFSLLKWQEKKISEQLAIPVSALSYKRLNIEVR